MIFSIITPVFNRQDCIERCIKSVVNSITQGGVIEHIIVDDGSSDSTADVVEQYARQYDHIKFIKFPQNRGTNAARNSAIAAAKGNWCIILDSDDYFVDNAISTIQTTLKVNSGYKHYMFAPDDMLDYYKSNVIIKGREQCVLSYPDFLNGYVGGDFIHVCNTEILRRHPFDENLRTYEGAFFLMFYRDAKEMLFTNKIVTIRERSRQDSVTREFFRTNLQTIQRNISATKLVLNEFSTEMESLGMVNKLREYRLSLYDNLLLLSKYDEARNIYKQIKPLCGNKERLLKFIEIFQLGLLYRFLLRWYLLIKYNVFRTQLDEN